MAVPIVPVVEVTDIFPVPVWVPLPPTTLLVTVTVKPPSFNVPPVSVNESTETAAPSVAVAVLFTTSLDDAFIKLVGRVKAEVLANSTKVPPVVASIAAPEFVTEFPVIVSFVVAPGVAWFSFKFALLFVLPNESVPTTKLLSKFKVVFALPVICRDANLLVVPDVV